MTSVAVVGAGAVGVTAARHLATGGADVTVYDREGVAAGASGRAAGIVYDAVAEDADAAVAARAIEQFRALAADGAITFDERPYLWFARAGDRRRADAIREQVPRMCDHGRDVTLLDGAAVAERLPGHDADDVAVGALARDAACVDPAAYTEAVADRAADAGATIRTGTPVALAESGTTVVAAAGNENKVDRLAYPARAPAAICVAGCISRCRRRRIDEHLRDRRLWVHEPSFRDGPYCSARGCHRRTDCTSQEHRWWHGNVEPMGYKPDVSASAVHFTGHETPPIREGTSFSTPLITGALGRLVGETDGRVPTGEALAQLIRRNSKFLGADLAPQADHNRQQFAMSEIRNALDET